MLACLLMLPSVLFAETHPQLLFDSTDIPELQDRITREPYLSMFNELVAFGEIDTTAGVEYGQTSAAVNCAFLYILTGDELWAEKARGYVEQRIYATGSHGWDVNIKGLTLYWHGRGVALAYDFCYNSAAWQTPADVGDPGSEPFRDRVRTKLKAQADRIYTSGGTEQNTNPASNWQNNRFASAGLIYLAIEESLSETERQAIDGCMGKVTTYLVRNMGDSPDSRGYNIEAIGYQMYPWSFTGPFAIAAERIGYGRLADAAPAAAGYALWNVYSNALRIPHLWGDHYGIHLDFGDDNNSHRGEGCYGLAFYFCPEFLHPGLRYWYDRIVGELGDQTWDRERIGTMYSILYYRDDIAPANPGLIKEWTNASLEVGGNGYFTFRSDYLHGDDMMAQIYAKFRGNAGHSGPDALSFRIAGLDAPFAVGGGRYGPDIYAADTGAKQDAYLRSMNTLYPVDPANELTISGDSGKLKGVPQLFPEGGGSVTLSIARNNVNTQNHTRRFLADYSDASGAEAVYVISDTSDDGYWWQLCQVDLDPAVDAITTSGNTFMVTNPNGTSMKGTVLYPEGPLTWTTGTRIRGSDYGYYGVRYGENEFVHLQSADGDYLVVMTVVDAGGTHPDVSSISGSEPNDQTVQIGGLLVTVDGDHISRGNAVQVPPSVVIDSPGERVTLAPGPHDLDVDGRAFPGSAPLQALEVYYGELSEYLGDGSLDTVTGLFQFTIPELPIGSHLFRVKAVDASGLARYSDYIPFSVHLTQPPLLSITHPGNGTILEKDAFVEITLDASDPDPDGGIAEVSLFVNGLEQSLSGSGPWTSTLDTSATGNLRIEAVAIDASGESAVAISDVLVNLGQLPAPWVNFDVGDVGATGQASASGDTLSISGSGNDIWNSLDEFHYAFQPFTGNGEIIARVDSQQNTNQWAKAGPMFRATAGADSRNVGIYITPSNGVTLQIRGADGSTTSSTRISGVTAPEELRLVRAGNTITGYHRESAAVPWQVVGSFSLDLPASVLAGLAVTSHADGAVSTVDFSGVELLTEVPAPRPSLRLQSGPGGGLQALWMAETGIPVGMEISHDLNNWVPYALPAEGTGSEEEMDLSQLPAPFFLRAVNDD